MDCSSLAVLIFNLSRPYCYQLASISHMAYTICAFTVHLYSQIYTKGMHSLHMRYYPQLTLYCHIKITYDGDRRFYIQRLHRYLVMITHT